MRPRAVNSKHQASPSFHYSFLGKERPSSFAFLHRKILWLNFANERLAQAILPSLNNVQEGATLLLKSISELAPFNKCFFFGLEQLMLTNTRVLIGRELSFLLAFLDRILRMFGNKRVVGTTTRLGQSRYNVRLLKPVKGGASPLHSLRNYIWDAIFFK